MWQDILLSVGTLILGIALIPAAFHKEKPPLATSIPTGLVLYSFGLAYVTLGLWYAFGSVLFNATLWAILAVQKWRKHE
jgi:hypothetical protein